MTKPILEMSINEAEEESRRRAGRLKAGLPMQETLRERQKRLMVEDRRLECAVQTDVAKLFRAYGCTVYWLSQPRETKQTPGIADLWVTHTRAGRAWWFESKKHDGVQSDDQVEFELNCVRCGIRYVCGGVKEAEEELIRIGVAERKLNGELDFRR